MGLWVNIIMIVTKFTKFNLFKVKTKRFLYFLKNYECFYKGNLFFATGSYPPTKIFEFCDCMLGHTCRGCKVPEFQVFNNLDSDMGNLKFRG